MLVSNPQRINHHELQILAQRAKGSIKHIYLHWTGGRYGQVFDDYHLNIDQHGEIYQTCRELTDLKKHTWERNTGSISITLCCALDAFLSGTLKPIYCGNEPTELQVNQMAVVIAILCHELELEISFSTVKTHAEVAYLDGYGPGQDKKPMRWDLISLSGLPETKELRPGGYLLREKALEYSKLFEHSRVLAMPQPQQQELELLAA